MKTSLKFLAILVAFLLLACLGLQAQTPMQTTSNNIVSGYAMSGNASSNLTYALPMFRARGANIWLAATVANPGSTVSQVYTITWYPSHDGVNASVNPIYTNTITVSATGSATNTYIGWAQIPSSVCDNINYLIPKTLAAGAAASNATLTVWGSIFP